MMLKRWWCSWQWCGENHWSAANLKRALANDWYDRLSEKEFAHLQTLLPKPPAHHPHYAFRFID
ncbi:hypothetical protein ACLK19_13190 [Escherichia coli]